MKKIGEILIEAGKVSERDIDRALLAQREMGERIGQVLIKLGLVSELDMIQALSQQLDIPVLLGPDYPEEPVSLPEIPDIFLLSNGVVPVSRTDDSVVFAASVPQDDYLKKALAMSLDKGVSVVFGLE
ncbi:MAG: type II secretion system protein GspE, partial [Halieaceae bacterium]|nr:type II secretion system protein GspE [Halieaceae bacterium]